MGRKNRRPKGSGHLQGEFRTTLAKRMKADGELKPLSYVPVKYSSKPTRNRRGSK